MRYHSCHAWRCVVSIVHIQSSHHSSVLYVVQYPRSKTIYSPHYCKRHLDFISTYSIDDQKGFDGRQQADSRACRNLPMAAPMQLPVIHEQNDMQIEASRSRNGVIISLRRGGGSRCNGGSSSFQAKMPWEKDSSVIFADAFHRLRCPFPETH